jgi:hypothetical protein
MQQHRLDFYAQSFSHQKTKMDPILAKLNWQIQPLTLEELYAVRSALQLQAAYADMFETDVEQHRPIVKKRNFRFWK